MLRTPAWARAWSVLRLVISAVIITAIVAAAFIVRGTRDRPRERRHDGDRELLQLLHDPLERAGGDRADLGGRLVLHPRTRAVSGTPGACRRARVCDDLHDRHRLVYNTCCAASRSRRAASRSPGRTRCSTDRPALPAPDLFLGPLRRDTALAERGRRWPRFPILWVVYTLMRGPLITNPVSAIPSGIRTRS